MEQYLDLLLGTQLFSGMAREELVSMIPCLSARVVRVMRGGAVFLEGDPAEYICVVLEGGVQIMREDYDGGRSILGAAQPGDIFAEAFACAGLTSLPVSAIAVRDSTIALISCRRILTVCSSACAFHNRLIANLMTLLARKNLMLSEKIQAMSCKTTREKVMTYLTSEAKKRGCNEFTIPYDRQALADYLGVERSAMSAEIGKLRKEGLLETKGSWFRLLRPHTQNMTFS